MTINSAGNVGIGTDNPATDLNVRGDLLVEDSAGTRYVRIDAPDAGNNYVGRIGTTSSHDLALVSNNVEAMRIDSSSNVGIGTTSPDGLLHVSSSSGDTVVVIESDTNNIDENDNPVLKFVQDGGNTVAQAGLTGNPGSVFTGSLANSAYFGNNESASVQLYTNLTARLTVESGGNVGIGTTNPDSTLHIESTSNANSPILTIENDDAKQIELGVVRSIAGVEPNTSFLAYDNDFRFIAGAGSTNEVMRIDSNGKVGIGTDQPEVSLDLGSKNDAVSLPAGDNTARGNIANPTIGMIRYNTTDFQFEGYSGVGAAATWGALGGGGGGTGTITTNNFSGNGTVGPFTLGATPSGGSTSFVDVFIDGVYQEISTYTVSGTALSFVTGSEPPTGTNIQTKTTSGAVSGALVSSVDIGQSSGNTGAVNLRIVPLEVTSGQTISGNANSLYIFTATGAQSIATVTLPGSPTLGDSIKISNLGGLANVLGANGNKIMGVAADLTINTPTAAFELIWSGSNNGWIIIGNV
jgi:hypothetical protein